MFIAVEYIIVAVPVLSYSHESLNLIFNIILAYFCNLNAFAGIFCVYAGTRISQKRLNVYRCCKGKVYQNIHL